MSSDPTETASLSYLESLWQDYRNHPDRVSHTWRRYFDSLEGKDLVPDVELPPEPAETAPAVAAGTVASQERLDSLVWAFRAWGHLAANVDPLGLRGVGESYWAKLHPTSQLVELSLPLHGLSDADLERMFSSPLRNEPTHQLLRDILDELHETYCGSIGYQFMHVQDIDIRDWFLEQIERPDHRSQSTPEARRRILEQLIRADAFEVFVRKKFPGAKVFSIDGSETLVPLVDLVLSEAVGQSVRSVVLGMAHRGRLNVLTNVFNKTPVDMFRSFADRLPQGPTGHGDVRYHLGDDAEWQDAQGRGLHLSLCFNPSHLEYVNPVAMGRVRAIQDTAGDRDRRSAMTLLIHGDAAFAAEGIVYETLNLGRLSAYDTGGIVHIIANNQIGFTTTPAENRATTYAADLARAVQIPVLHVNGEDLNAIHRAAKVAMDFRAQFRRDIIIDLIGFRRWGHNETDEPSFTQPRLYAAIDKHPRIKEEYAAELVAAEEITQQEVDRLEQDAVETLRRHYDDALQADNPNTEAALLALTMQNGLAMPPADDVGTGIDRRRLVKLLEGLATMPDGFHVHPKLVRSQDERRKMAAGEETIDWATAEALAIASLAEEGHNVRLAGQDTQRGTFSHRHAILHDVVNGGIHNIFDFAARGKSTVEIINSPLNEAAAMGFEYGYSLDRLNALVMWEAQFGDFVNVAQVIIDQFLASAEDKWEQLNRLVLLLPHGFEGQGPEHSSARMERFLTLAADDNMQIVQVSTPVQYFHFLRRQVISPRRKPMVIFTPKSLLRSKAARSPLNEFESGRAQSLIADRSVKSPERALMCSGKIYYDLLSVRDEKHPDTAIVRVEQFYPLSDDEIRTALDGYKPGTPVVWVQEEPENMGAWRYFRARFGDTLWGEYPLYGVARPSSASPATGSKYLHRHEQQAVLDQAWAELPRRAEPRIALPVTQRADDVKRPAVATKKK